MVNFTVFLKYFWKIQKMTHSDLYDTHSVIVLAP